MSRVPALYLITDRTLSPRPLPALVEATLARVDPRRVAVQLREKDLGARALFELGTAVKRVCDARGVPLLINDRVDVALALGAGVHLGGDSMRAADVRPIVGPKVTIGVSCHGVDEVRRRSPGADFATWGPVFPTPSKARYGPPVAFEGLEEAQTVGVPLLALGGIKRERVAELKERGFAGIACIGAVFGAEEPGAAAAELLDALDALDALESSDARDEPPR